jgi:hypothetical protein
MFAGGIIPQFAQVILGDGVGCDIAEGRLNLDAVDPRCNSVASLQYNKACTLSSTASLLTFPCVDNIMAARQLRSSTAAAAAVLLIILYAAGHASASEEL